MSYLGRGLDKISNIEVLDNITFDGSSSYSITKSSVAFTPNSAQSLLISIDGVVQATNFTVSSSTINFGVAVPSTSTCDFFLHYGTGLITIPADGTVSLAKLSATGTKDATTFLRGDNTFASAGSPSIVDNGNATAITIDSSENVGIGTASPGTKLDIVSDSSARGIYLRGRSADNIGLIDFRSNDGSTRYASIGSQSANTFSIETNSVERMRIGSNGYVGIGTTTLSRQFNVYSTGEPPARFQRQQGDNALRTHLEFIREGSTAGEIQCTNTSTTYATSSDYRLKENVSYDFDATTRLKQLKPARFNFIANADKTVDGFIAHEVQSVVPEAITGEKDATETKEKVVVNANGQVIAENIEQVDWEAGKIADENGNTQYPIDSTWETTKVVPVYQGIDQAKLVPLLVKTIQELEARITQLENA